MKILMCNNFYYRRGGCETYLFGLSTLLREKGHEVLSFSMDSSLNSPSEEAEYFLPEISFDGKASLYQKFQNLIGVFYNKRALDLITELIEDQKPDLVHCHNIAHYLSPSILFAARKHNIPVVQTVHDYKLVCPAWLFLSKGRICESCIGNRYYYAFFKKCIKESYFASLVGMTEAYLHHLTKIYVQNVSLFIAPSRFVKEKLALHGIPKEKLEIVPNFLYKEIDPINSERKGSYFLYVGRLSQEKGLATLLMAMKTAQNYKLKIVGDGPMRNSLEYLTKEQELHNVSFEGYLSGQELKLAYQGAISLIVPSICHETSGLVIQEAFSYGVPVIASRVGAFGEIIRDGYNGFLVSRENANELYDKMTYMYNNPLETQQMGQRGRETLLGEYAPAKHYEGIIRCYKKVGLPN